jgi:uncharacterized protein (TIGR02145 family)
MRNYLVIIVFFLVTMAQAQIMLPAYQAIQYRRSTLPTVITTTVTSITPSKGVSGGTVSNDGGSPVIVRGVCWDTSPGPTIALPTKTNDGTGIGTFISNLVLLTPNTTYYLRAYATNSVGTAYGNQLSFTTSPAAPLQSVTICNQVWSSKNLDVTTYSDGTPIPQVTDNTAWANLTIGAWCYYNNDPANGPIYGKLYNWYAIAGIYDAASLADPALRKKLAPTGWHVPAINEWNTLFDCLGGYLIAGGKMKETGTTHWFAPNVSATNVSNFTGLPGSYRNEFGPFETFWGIGKWGYFWSSTSIGAGDYAYSCYLSSDNEKAITATGNTIRRGNSLRLVQD